MTDHSLQFYIDGAWRAPHGTTRVDVIDPSTEQPFASIAMGSAQDVDDAVAAARRAFASFGMSTREERVALLERVIAVYERRQGELAEAISREMGAPLALARQAHAAAGLAHLREALSVLREHAFDEVVNKTRVVREPVGVCALITPWNWPMNQVGCKVAAALAAGCTMVLKPSEMSPISALIFAEILDEAGVPPGVFNLVNGDGAVVGTRMASHPDVDMVSFTGSTRAGVLVAKAAADSVKRVHQELGGKSPNIILGDADFKRAVTHGVRACFNNSGQSCNAPTRLLVPKDRHAEAVAIAREVAAQVVVGDPRTEGTVLGPVISAAQFAKIQGLIQQGIDESAELVAGGTGRPEGLGTGYYVKPTIFAGVRNEMTIAREEVFGPVLAILPYTDEDDAVAIANDTVYGLSSYVSSGDLDHARRVARRLRAGMVHINGAGVDRAAAFGGYKQSGNGREWGRFGIEDFLEIKSMFGHEA
ncbi:aldehyde dehydrogenase family protein [Rhizobacter sp. Root404]|uniref:aldehyde dehydrogenase family protein n=1 Tax=Rhizobacter sp. Root404 TaxID=1736528 RepID=UPI0006F6D5DD|nr:aldehyde dehydrogenase family protein [Rhizobacter sp. Root404]KQW37737.1 aldehyde dehydrogenase [Rhizobacter sp. Root404]